MIKVCGMREPDNIRAVDSLGINMMGFIFWPKSSRYVNPGDSPREVMETVSGIHAKRVGVFVDEDPGQVRRLADDFSLDYIQLHGQESPAYIFQLRGLHVIKAFNIATEDDLLQTRPYEGIVDYFLFDTKGKSVGGNGEKFDWSVLSSYDGSTPFLLSGGIGPDDAERLRASHHEKCVGIDLNSRFEIAPGLKDVDALRKFLNELNE